VRGEESLIQLEIRNSEFREPTAD